MSEIVRKCLIWVVLFAMLIFGATLYNDTAKVDLSVRSTSIDIESNLVSSNVESDSVSSFVLTLDPNGGSGFKQSLGVEYGSQMPMPTEEGFELFIPSRAGYVFAGYWDEEEEGGNQYYNKLMQSINVWDKRSDGVLYARWIGQYLVELNAMGGVKGTKSTVVLFGRALDNNINPPIMAMYRFLGYWNEPETGGKQYYDKDMNALSAWDVKGNGVLYARWARANAGQGFGLLDYNEHANTILLSIGIGSVVGIVVCLFLLRLVNKKRTKVYIDNSFYVE